MSAIRRIEVAVFAALACVGTAQADTMPQLDFGDRANGHLLVSQVVWGGVIFAVFYLLVSRWGLPRVGSVLTMRAEAISADLEKARASKAQADQAVDELNAARSRAYAESQAAIAEAARKAKEEAAARSAEQEGRLAAQLADSEAQIARARNAAMAALREIAGETAVAVVARVTNARADTVRVQEAVGRILSERGLAA